MALPTGPTVTFLFTDIEGSTRLERSLGSAAWAEVVALHDGLLRQSIEANGGEVVKTEGDAVFAAFDRPAGAIGAVVDAQRALAAGGVELADEGLRAVKDFDEPLRLHRLVVPGAADDGRPLRTLTAPSNLPAEVTDLIGREAELERLRDELDETRILTLTGPG